MRKNHRKTRRKLKKQKQIIIISILFLTIILSVGYAAFQSSISLNITGNIKQKPFGIEKLKENITTSGDGLYTDLTINGYVYKGANPNNWIKFNNEDYRIVNIDSENNLKIVKNTSIGVLPFDLGYNSNVTGITTNNSNDGTRYSENVNDYCNHYDEIYRGCKIWGSGTTMRDNNGTIINKMKLHNSSNTTYNLPEYEAYINIYLNGGTYLNHQITGWYQTLTNFNEKQYVNENYHWKVGILTGTNNVSINENILEENSYLWYGTVGLISTSDYIKGSINPNCTNTYQYHTSETCSQSSQNHNYLSKNKHYWFINPRSNGSQYVWFAESNNYTNFNTPYNTKNIYPSLHLKPQTKLTGYGTESKPYKIYIKN